ncbi:MAG TPA: PAS domain-containing protein [Candidatus Angelobacter sp.]|nr:PAS domain-containing protein [Candidatus Angelobacter sp.]
MDSITQKEFDSSAEERIARLSAKVFELTEANRSLANTQMLVEAMLNNIPDRIYFKDTQSRFVKISKALAERLGLSHPDDAIGKTDFDFFHPAEKAREFYEDEQRIIKTGEPLINKTEKKVLPNGDIAWTSTTKVPLRNREGAVVGIVGINRDITELKVAEQKIEAIHRELREASRQAGMAEVATGVLHNVGNVLNSVNVAAGVLSDRLNNSKAAGVSKLSKLLTERQNDLSTFFAEDERGRQVPAYLKQLSEHIEKEQADMRKELHELVMNVEHIKEIVATQQNYARVLGVAEVVDLSEVMEDAIRIHGGSYERHAIKLIREYDKLPQMTLDKHKVMQILINFLSNAKYACDAGAKAEKIVTVRIKQLGKDKVKLEVADNGIGIAPENVTRIFSQGFTTRKGGHGFGLHSGALAAKDLSGDIRAHSEGIGKGATFILELPIVEASGQPKG